MENLNEIIAYIARTNLFNFIIFAGIIAFIVCKLNVKSKMEAAVKDVEVSINDSEAAKSASEEKLSDIEKSMERLSEEIDSIMKKSEDNATLIGENIAAETQNTVDTMHENMQKAIENNLVVMKNDILRRAALASVEVARAHITKELEKNPDLHSKLINESIEAIEGTEG